MSKDEVTELLHSHFIIRTLPDGPEWQKHIGNKQRRRELANQFKDAKNPFKIVIVREGEAPRRSWLTGFDAPCLHTMYADKPMQGHGGGRTKYECRRKKFGRLRFILHHSAFRLCVAAARATRPSTPPRPSP